MDLVQAFTQLAARADKLAKLGAEVGLLLADNWFWYAGRKARATSA